MFVCFSYRLSPAQTVIYTFGKMEDLWYQYQNDRFHHYLLYKWPTCHVSKGILLFIFKRKQSIQVFLLVNVMLTNDSLKKYHTNQCHNNILKQANILPAEHVILKPSSAFMAFWSRWDGVVEEESSGRSWAHLLLSLRSPHTLWRRWQPPHARSPPWHVGHEGGGDFTRSVWEADEFMWPTGVEGMVALVFPNGAAPGAWHRDKRERHRSAQVPWCH